MAGDESGRSGAIAIQGTGEDPRRQIGEGLAVGGECRHCRLIVTARVVSSQLLRRSVTRESLLGLASMAIAVRIERRRAGKYAVTIEGEFEEWTRQRLFEFLVDRGCTPEDAVSYLVQADTAAIITIPVPSQKPH